MLNFAKAFAKFVYKHIQYTLISSLIPSNMRCLFQKLSSSNLITIEVNKKYSITISLQNGVTKGLPLSPTIYILCQDFDIKHIADPNVSRNHGFQLHLGMGNIYICGFADDTVII